MMIHRLSGRLYGALRAGGYFYGQVCLAARAADCKSVTSETPKVRVLPCPLFCSRIPTGRGSRLKPGSVRVQLPSEAFVRYIRTPASMTGKSKRICLCSRIGICAGLRTRAGNTTAGSSPARDIYAGVTERNTYLPQKRGFEGSSPFSCTLCPGAWKWLYRHGPGPCVRKDLRVPPRVLFAVMPQLVPGRS